MLVFGVNPLRLYVYEEGLARFATVAYETPCSKNMNNMFMHLTNYAINKNSDSFKQNESIDGGGKSHKRSLSQIYKLLRMRGHDVDKLKGEIDDLIIKTMITAQPTLW